MQLTIHRGTHQIGGCITEIKTASARIIIDIGAELPSTENPQPTPFKLEGVTYGNPDCNGIFITHYHSDHAGMYENILPAIPVYMGKTAKQIYAVVQSTLNKKLQKGNPRRVSEFKTFEIGKPVIINDVKITPYSVDHSAFDAYMFLIEAEGKRILHTGDFRMHGAKGKKMPAVFKKYANNIDVLITEGTMLSRLGENVITEHELAIKAKKIMSENKYVFTLCSSANIDTIAGFYNVAIANGRMFIVCEDDFQAEILRIVSRNSQSDFYNFNKKKIFVYGTNLHALMKTNGFCFLGRANRITQRAIEAFPESVTIYSMWKGYLDKSHPAFDEYKSAFVEKAAAIGSKIEFLHTSGHATAEDIAKVCHITGAKTVIPIHGENPEAFKNLNIDNEIKILQDGEDYLI